MSRVPHVSFFETWVLTPNIPLPGFIGSIPFQGITLLKYHFLLDSPPL
jgi:hypothetical protein